jgi:hypothetical protein
LALTGPLPINIDFKNDAVCGSASDALINARSSLHGHAHQLVVVESSHWLRGDFTANGPRNTDRDRVNVVRDWKHLRNFEAEERSACVWAVGGNVVVMVSSQMKHLAANSE